MHLKSNDKFAHSAPPPSVLGQPQNDLASVSVQPKAQSCQPVQDRANRRQGALLFAPEQDAGGAEQGDAQAHRSLTGEAVIQNHPRARTFKPQWARC
jgi:hypothetical protein